MASNNKRPNDEGKKDISPFELSLPDFADFFAQIYWEKRELRKYYKAHIKMYRPDELSKASKDQVLDRLSKMLIP